MREVREQERDTQLKEIEDFTKQDIWMDNKQRKKRLTSLVIGEI